GTTAYDESFNNNDGTILFNHGFEDEFTSTESWTENQMTGSISSNSYSGVITNVADPNMLYDITNFDEVNDHLKIRYKSYTDGPTHIRMYYTDNIDCSSSSETCAESFAIISDGSWHILETDISDAEWIDNDGTIDDLRFDFDFASVTGTVFLDYIRIFDDDISSWTIGKFGSALSFDGTDDWIDLGNDSKLQLSNGTISTWIKTSDAGVSWRGIITKQNAYAMFLEGNTFAIYDWGAAAARDTNQNLADNAWHFVAVSFQSGVTNGTTLYIDGKPSLVTSMTVSSQNNNVEIGEDNLGGSQAFAGNIDDVRIYNYARTQDEILADYNDGKSAHLGKNNQEENNG
ncbi:MAG: LamG domain-containing protein, partial [Patescibacteria group bacterium]|nr:LamG domain-containing protein [Patescibacteria group bacterium]